MIILIFARLRPFLKEENIISKRRCYAVGFLPSNLAPIGRTWNTLPLGNGGEGRNPGKRVKTFQGIV